MTIAGISVCDFSSGLKVLSLLLSFLNARTILAATRASEHNLLGGFGEYAVDYRLHADMRLNNRYAEDASHRWSGALAELGKGL